MTGPCMCGDTACSSCGPAQGHDPLEKLRQMEAFYDALYEKFPWLESLPDQDPYGELGVNVEELIDFVFEAGFQAGLDHVEQLLVEEQVARDLAEEAEMAEEYWNGKQE